ncbi:MAG: hypothetical protein HN904_05550 [Victivallales bacterium]|nr:hypothetical protein [Victivallales bacterium]
MRHSALLAILVGGTLSAQTANLLPNAGFEEVANGRPTKWTSNNFRTGGVARLETGKAHGGERYVALQSRDNTERIAWRAAGPLPAGTPFVAAGGWYRTAGLVKGRGRGASFRVHFYGTRDGKMRELGLRQGFFPPSAAWSKTGEKVYPVPAGAERVELQVFNWLMPGTTCWDDVWIRAVDKKEFAAMPKSQQLMSQPIPNVTLEAEAARIDPARAAVFEQSNFASKQGVALKDAQSTNVGKPETAPDLVFAFTAAQSGRYLIRTHAATDAKGTETMRRAKGKYDSLYLMLAVDKGRPTQRVVFVPWSRPTSCSQTLGKFDFNGKEQEIAVWLPEGVRLDRLQILPYVPPAVPDAVKAYKPGVAPPPSRPRLWVNETSLPQVRANLDRGENAPLWAKVRERAAKPVTLTIKPGTEIRHDRGLESAAVNKAFVYLMAGERAHGAEAVRLMRDYLAAVEFGNLLDITREIGRAIYSGSLVYDWCYDLMTPADRESIRTNLMRLADDMEIGWPPFRQMIVNGHGNEAQVNRDLLAMSIAIYSEDPVPYQYCAYRILEELVPMRRFEYQSPRHNQGVSYGPFRYSWDLHAAWLMRRMAGKPVFDDNIGDVYRGWLYMRVPGHRVLRDGDGFSDSRPANLGAATLLNYAYTGNPVVKWDFLRQGGMKGDPIPILLLNDPGLVPAEGLDELPQTIDYGPILGGMVARTGWNMGRNAADVVVEMKGGGYNFGNHQHADAGAFQIYYRGFQSGDLGQYHFYGTPYDSNFCKRSVAHSMLFVVDPAEKFRGTTTNDGGARFVLSCPLTPEQTTSNPLFANGTVLSSSVGPHAQRPFFSHFAVDLKSAYSDKIRSYVRSFCFLNLDNEQTPAVLIVLDALTTAKPEFEKRWQINALNPPERTAEGVVLHQSALGLTGKVNIRMLRPRPTHRELEILSGKMANSVAGTVFEAPKPNAPEGKGHRVVFSAKTARAQETFLTVLTMAGEDAPELPVAVAETPNAFVLSLANRVVVMPRNEKLLGEPLTVEVPPGQGWQLLLAGLAPGAWSIQSADGKTALNATVLAGQHTAFAVVDGGPYAINPTTLPGARRFTAALDFMPTPSAPLTDRVFMGSRLVPDARVKVVGENWLLPAEAVASLAGLSCAGSPKELVIVSGERKAVFQEGAKQFLLNGQPFALSTPAIRDAGTWYVSAAMLAALAGQSLAQDQESRCAELLALAHPFPKNVLWVEANQNSNVAELTAMLTAIPGRTQYWAAKGSEVQFDVVLTQPASVGAVGIQWHQGSKRQARFAIETSLDGKTWKRVFEGESSGKTAGLETYEFAPHEARLVRFCGFGNTANEWNSLVHFRVNPTPK